MCAKCCTPEMQGKIEHVQSVASDFSDGAFLAYCAENGVEVEDLEAYYQEHPEKKG